MVKIFKNLKLKTFITIVLFRSNRVRLKCVALVDHKFDRDLVAFMSFVLCCRRFAGDCSGDEESRNDFLLKCQRILKVECIKHQGEFQVVADLLSLSEVLFLKEGM